MLMSNCYLHQLLGRLKADDVEGRVQGEERSRRGMDRGGDHGLRFDLTGVIIEGVIPMFPPSLAGQGNKVL